MKKVDGFLASTSEKEGSSDALAAAEEALRAAFWALERAAKDEELRGDESLENGKWCTTFEGMSEYEDKTMETLAHAVSAGVSKEQAVREAQALIKRLVQLAQNKSAG
jgi:hypothetical protein